MLERLLHAHIPVISQDMFRQHGGPLVLAYNYVKRETPADKHWSGLTRLSRSLPSCTSRCAAVLTSRPSGWKQQRLAAVAVF